MSNLMLLDLVTGLFYFLTELSNTKLRNGTGEPPNERDHLQLDFLYVLTDEVTDFKSVRLGV